MDKVQEFDSVWDAIEESPEEAENMKLRSALMIVLQQFVAGCDTQRGASKILGISEPRVSYIVGGKIERFKLDMLVLLAHRAGFSISLDVSRQEAA